MKRILLIGVVCAMLLCGACGQAELADSSAPVAPATTTAPSVSDGLTFTATVLSVGEDWLLVEADADSDITGQVRVVTEETAAFAAGDRVTVRHTGQMMPSLPPQLVATRIEIIQ